MIALACSSVVFSGAGVFPRMVAPATHLCMFGLDRSTPPDASAVLLIDQREEARTWWNEKTVSEAMGERRPACF
jgi:hypothetical protein